MRRSGLGNGTAGPMAPEEDVRSVLVSSSETQASQRLSRKVSFGVHTMRLDAPRGPRPVAPSLSDAERGGGRNKGQLCKGLSLSGRHRGVLNG